MPDNGSYSRVKLDLGFEARMNIGLDAPAIYRTKGQQHLSSKAFKAVCSRRLMRPRGARHAHQL